MSVTDVLLETIRANQSIRSIDRCQFNCDCHFFHARVRHRAVKAARVATAARRRARRRRTVGEPCAAPTAAPTPRDATSW